MVARTTKIIPDELSLNQMHQHLQPVSGDLQEYSDPRQDFVDDSEKDDLDILNDVLSELGGTSDVKVNVYLLESGKSMAFVGSYAPDTFSIDAVQATYGAGEYSVQVRQGGRIRSRRVIRIAKPRETPQSNFTANGLELISKQIEESNAKFLAVLERLNMPQAPVKTTTDMLNELMLMKQVMGVDNKPQNNMQDFLTMLDVAKGLVPAQGEASTNDILMEGIRSLAPALMAGATQPRQQIPQQIPQRQNPIMPNVPYSPAPPIENPTEPAQPLNAEVLPIESDDMKIQERLFFNLLISNAQKDNDPAPYAAMLLDIVGDDVAEQMLNDPNWFKNLIEKDPRCQSFEQWFSELRSIMLDSIAEAKINESEPLTNENGAGINESNIVNSGEPDAIVINESSPNQ